MADTPSPRPGGPLGERGDMAGRTDDDELSRSGAPDVDAIEEWAADIRVDAETDRRRRESWLRRQAADDTSMTGVLVDLAEQGHLVRVTTEGGGRHQGRVRGAGAAVVVLDCGRTRVVVSADAVTTVHAVPGEREVLDPRGHRVERDPTSLGDLLSHVADDGTEVVLVTRAGQTITGEVQAVGRDVVMVRPDRRAPVVYARLQSLSEAVLPLSTRSG